MIRLAPMPALLALALLPACGKQDAGDPSQSDAPDEGGEIDDAGDGGDGGAGDDGAGDDAGDDAGDGGDSGAVDTDEPLGEWAVTLDLPAEIELGERFELDVQVVSPDYEDVTDQAQIAVVVSPTRGAVVDGGYLSFTELGTFTISVTATIEDQQLSASGELTTVPGPPAWIDLSFEEASVPPGVTVTPSWTVEDAWGNALDPEVILAVSPSGLTIDGDQLVTDALGTYYVTAQVADTSIYDTEVLQVITGDAVDIALTLSDDDAELGDTVTASVSAVDAWGNPLEAVEAALSVSPSDGVTVEGMSLTFEEEGSFTVTASYGELSDSQGPVIVDSNGPLITITTPTRGAAVDGGAVSVSGQVTDAVTGVSAFTLGGSAITPASDGSFSAEVSLDRGANVIEITAEDGDGNTSDVLLGVLAGEFIEAGEVVEDLLDLRLEDAALEEMGGSFDGALDASALESALAAGNPVLDDDYSSLCFELSSYVVADIEGLDWVTTLSGLSIDMGGEYDYCATGPYALIGEVTASEAAVTTLLNLSVVDGAVVAEVHSSEVSLSGYGADFSASGDLDSLLDAAGVDLEVDIQEMLEATLVDAVEAELPAAVGGGLSALAISEELDMDGAALALDAWIRDLEADEGGLTLYLEGTLDGGVTASVSSTNPGSLQQDGGHPDLSGGAPLVLGLSLDTFNRLLFAAWEAGAFEQTVTDEELGLDSTLIGLIFPGATTLDLEISAAAPPVMTAGTGGGMYDFAMVELTLRAWGDVGGVYSELGLIAAHATGIVDLRVNGANELVMTTTLDGATFDAIPGGADEVADAESLEALLDAFGGSLTSGVIPEVAVPLPDLSGLSVDASGVSVVSDDWAAVECEVD
jgi:hypothetical protein